ncbi:MAG TPA: glycosyltransferase [Spirochaetota bacterium]|nr:glycosyltransferase [Spirochaetota bacterium]HOL55954.1 glycosyltransferase [Spirochaetota bacterium]
MDIKVSIIVPVYNVENYIRRCLESLINQTLREIEIILIDDCSTDNSGKICDEYAKIDPRIDVIHNEKNIKQGLSRNKGIEIARGEYIGFVDSDDYVDLDFYEKLYDCAIKDNYDIVKGGRKDIFDDKIVISNLNEVILDGLKKGYPIFSLFTYEHWSAIYKKDLLDKNNIRYPNLSNAQDMLFLFFVGIKTKKIGFVNNVFYNYYVNQNSTTFRYSKKYFENILYVDEIRLSKINEMDLNKEIYDYCYENYVNHLISNYYNLLKIKELNSLYKEYYNEIIKLIFSYKYYEKIELTKIKDIILGMDDTKKLGIKTLIKMILQKILKKIFCKNNKE